MKSPLKRLEYNRILTNKDPNSLSKGFVLEKREQFRKNPPGGIDVRKIFIHLFVFFCQNKLFSMTYLKAK
jgi:hypothetical protein